MGSWAPPLPGEFASHLRSCVGFEYRLPRAAVHYGVPSTTSTLIFSFDEPLDCGWLRPPQLRDHYWVLLSGLHTEPALVRTHGVQYGIQLALTPRGCRALLGLPIGALAGVIVDQSELEPSLRRLHEQLTDASWDSRFGLIGSWVRHRLSRVRDVDQLAPPMAQAWQLIRTSHGRLPVADVADHVGWSRRHLTGRFTAEFGVPPKDVARIARFEYARHLAGRGTSWADAAALAGYCDQSHLTREWRALAGRTPAESGEDFPIVQATSS